MMASSVVQAFAYKPGLILSENTFSDKIYAVTGEKGKVSFTATEPDEDGCFTIEMTMDDLSFVGYQFALRYNSAAAVPVDSSGRETSSFDSFAQMGVNNISTIGTGVNSETGFFEFSGFIMPGTSASNIKDGAMTMNGETVYTFYFKQVSDEPLDLEIAAASETEPYQKALPTGAALLDMEGDVPSAVTFDLTALSQEKVDVEMPSIDDEKPTGSVVEKPAQTPVGADGIAKRLSGAVILQLGNYGAVVNGAVVRIDPDSTAVQPYAHDNRTFVPVRFLSERMGAIVGWDQATKTVTVTRAGRTVQMVLGQNTYWVDGVQKTMDAPAEVVSQRTMVPIRFVSEALGLSVAWDQTNKLVVVTEANAPWIVGENVEISATERVLNLLAARDFV